MLMPMWVALVAWQHHPPLISGHNGWGWLGPLHHLWDWTDGCIAVSNDEMREIWLRVANGTPIEIH